MSKVIKENITFGIMCLNLEFSQWEAKCIENLLNLEYVQLKLLIIDDCPREGYLKKIHNFIKNVFSNKLLWGIYTRVIDKKQQSLKKVNLKKKLQNTKAIKCKIQYKGKYTQLFDNKNIVDIKTEKLDFILRFGFDIIMGDILNATKYGIWSFQHGDNEKYRGMPSGFWELYFDDPLTGGILQKLTDKIDGGIILKKGFTLTRKLSLAKNKDYIYNISTKWPAKVCHDILNGKHAYIFDKPKITNAPVYKTPTNLIMLKFGIRLIKNLITYIKNCVFVEQDWNIGIINEPVHHILENDFDPKICWLNNDDSRFWADPFIVEYKNEKYITFEEYQYKSAKGKISSINIRNNKINKYYTSLENSAHLSYPFLIEYNDNIYCIPESYSLNEIALYKAIDFPKTWQKIKILVKNVRGVDSTLFNYNNNWWLFFTINNKKIYECNSNLYIYHALEFTGPYQSHVLNPVKSDPRSTRPAGELFIYQNKLHRPAQNCTKTAGGNIEINKIIELTTNQFNEEVVLQLMPFNNTPYKDGIHNISYLNNVTIIDGMRFKRKKLKSILKDNSKLLYKIIHGLIPNGKDHK